MRTKCSGVKKYKAVRPPVCGCQACALIWKRTAKKTRR